MVWGWLYYQQELSKKLLCICLYCLSMNIQNESYVLIGTCIERHNQIKMLGIVVIQNQHGTRESLTFNILPINY